MRNLRDQQFIDGLKDFCRVFEKYSNLTMLEIGVFKGESTKIFKDSGIFSKQYCVDPWNPSIDTKDGMNYSDAIQAEEEFHRQFDNDKNIVPVKGTIDTFIQNFKNASIDVVYVDGAHNYESVKNDILKIMQYVKPKIAICGHDYNDPEYSLEMDQPGVRQAIEETLGLPDRKFLDTSWIKWVDTHKKINEIELDYDFLMHNAQLINCKSNADRLQLEKMIFEYHRLQFPNVFDAYTIADPGDASAANTSHKRIIQYAQKECLPYILIFEDDCYFINDIEHEIKNAIAHVPDDADILQFSYNYNNNSRKLEYNRIFNDQCTCIAMYIIFKKAYQKTIDLLNSGIWMDRLQCNLISYTLNKPICIQYNFNYSTTRGDYRSYDIERLNAYEQQLFNNKYPKIEDILKSHYSKFIINNNTTNLLQFFKQHKVLFASNGNKVATPSIEWSMSTYSEVAPEIYVVNSNKCGTNSFIEIINYAAMHDYDYVIYIDADCFIANLSNLKKIFQQFVLGDFSFAGMPDGGCIPIRHHNKFIINPFFSMYNIKQCCKHTHDWQNNSFLTELDQINEAYLNDILSKCPNANESSFSIDNFENYYGLFSKIASNTRIMYLIAGQINCNADPTTAIYVNEALEKNIVCLHSWYARNNDAHNLNRIKTIYDFSHSLNEIN